MATGIQIVWWKLALWILAVSFLGVILAVPMRRQMIEAGQETVQEMRGALRATNGWAL